MPLILKTPPAAEPISLAEAKPHLRVDGDDEDNLITALITTARQLLEDITGRAFITQTWQYILDAFPEEEFCLPKPPLRSVTSITYKLGDGTVKTLAATDYIVDTASAPARIVPAPGLSWPSETLYPLNAVTVEYEAGYGGAADVPAPLKHAMLLLVGHWYEHREEIVLKDAARNLPLGVSALITPYRVW